MARKLVVVLAVAVLLFAMVVSAASAYKTTVTTVVLEEGEEAGQEGSQSQQQKQCREQLKGQQQLSHCQQLLSSGGKVIVLGKPRSGVANPEHLQECCQQLKQVQEQCRCQGIEEVVKLQQQQGKLQGQKLRQVIQTAENLPNLCGLQSTRPCKISIRAAGGSGGSSSEEDDSFY